jgi:hypothetical protein
LPPPHAANIAAIARCFMPASFQRFRADYRGRLLTPSHPARLARLRSSRR